MKAIFSGVITFLLIGIIAFAILRARGLLGTSNTSTPSPSPSVVTNWDMLPDTAPDATPSPTPSATPRPSTSPVGKGGVTTGAVQGATTTVTKVTTTSTVTHVNITAIKTSDCGSYTAKIEEINGPLTLSYKIHDNYSAAITVWKDNGEEIVSETLYTGDGVLTKVDGVSGLKIQASASKCDEPDFTWLEITASR